MAQENSRPRRGRSRVFLGLFEMVRRRAQFALVGAIFVLISYLVLMINGLGVGLNAQAGGALRSFDADALAYSGQAGLSLLRSELSAETAEAIGAVDGVEESALLGYVSLSYVRESGEVDSAAVLGYDPGTIAEPEIVDGEPLTPEQADGLLADREFLRAAGYQLGDRVTLTLRLEEREFTIVGVIDEGAFFFQPSIYLLRTTWQELRYGENPTPPEASIMLLKGDGLVGTEGEGFEIVSKSTAFANVEGVEGQQSTVVALRWFGYLIGTMVIGAFFYVITLQKVPQIGVLKAIGASNWYVLRQVLLQAVLVSIGGIIIATPLSIVTQRLLTRTPDSVPIAFTTDMIVVTLLSLMGAALVGSLFSARRVLSIDPIIALGQQQ